MNKLIKQIVGWALIVVIIFLVIGTCAEHFYDKEYNPLILFMSSTFLSGFIYFKLIDTK